MTGKTILETKRLLLTEWQEGSSEQLKIFLQDPSVMYAYEGAFSDEEVQKWLENMLESYKTTGYGLWALILKETKEVIGECGLTNQWVADKKYLEIGYHLQKKYWHQGYAIEAAQAVKEYAFQQLGVTEIASIVRDTNLASMNVAIRNQMLIRERFIKHYKGIDMPHYLFTIRKK